jgi:hypothetical protein
MPARAFHAVPNAIYCSFHLTGPEASTTGTFWILGFKSAAPLPTLADVQAVVAVAAAWLSGVSSPKSLIAQNFAFDYIRAWSQAEEAGPEFTQAVSVAGSAVANDNGTEACLLKMETGIHARGKFGRLFFGPIDGSQPAGNGYIDIAYADAVAGSVAALQSAEDAAGYPGVVISQKYALCYTILDVVGGRVVAIQTRRGTGRD